MFKTYMGPVEDEAAVVYLRPETAQGIYVNFKNVQAESRKKLPFGIAQIGKAFRNEISPGNFVFRMREFEQMEMQYFVRPDEATAAFEEWLPRAARVVRALRRDPVAAPLPRARARTSSPTTRRRRSTSSTASRSAGRSSRASTTAATSTCREPGEVVRREPRILRPGDRGALHPVHRRDVRGRDRAAFTFLIDGYREEEVRGEKRVSLGLHPELAPYKVAVLPLLKKRPEIVELATSSGRTCSATRWPSTTTRPRSASCTAARTRSGRRGA